MLTRLQLGDGVDVPHRFGLLAVEGGAGTTFVARAIALVLANDLGRRVCLVDLNWWSPSSGLAEDELEGVADVIRGTADVDSSLVSTTLPELSLLPAGAATVSERSRFAHSPELQKILVELSEPFDHVVIDLPSLATTSDALSLAEESGAVALVVERGVTQEGQIKTAVAELQGIPFLGVVLNRNRSDLPRFLRRRFLGLQTRN
jgi:Mrp family chromosome partitioning ATPase